MECIHSARRYQVSAACGERIRLGIAVIVGVEWVVWGERERRRTVVSGHQETAEDGMLRARLIVHFAYELLLIIIVPFAEREQTTRITCGRKLGRYFYCDGTEQLRVNLIVHERRF